MCAIKEEERNGNKTLLLECSGREWQGSVSLTEIRKDQNETICRGPSHSYNRTPRAYREETTQLPSTAKY